MKTISRRGFLAVGGVAVASGVMPLARSAEGRQSRYKVIGFVKPIQDFENERLADAAVEIGWDGIECPVRANGRIKAETAGEELPKLVEELRKRGKELTIITTDIVSVKQKETEPLLRLAAKLGVKYYRLGFWKYAEKKSIPEQVKENAAALKDLAALNREIGICGGIQNHSGPDYFGAPVWDHWMALKDLDPKFLGAYFDIAHASKEGGSSWPIEARLMEPHLVTVSVKDFVWEKKGDRTTARWVSLGEGLVEKRFFEWLKSTKFAGPISHHVEFPVGDPMIGKIKRDAETLRGWISA